MFIQCIKTPLGVLTVAADDNFLLWVKFLELKLPKKTNPNHITQNAIQQLNEYFNGERFEFELPINFNESFKGNTLKKLYNLDYGKTITYSNLALKVGNAKASRAVGSAMATNPFVIVIPCHRVVKKDGNLGNYFYGVAYKKWLIEHEKKHALKLYSKEYYYFDEKSVTKLMSNSFFKPYFKEHPPVIKYTVYKDPFTALAIPIIHQQINTKTAAKIEQVFMEYNGYVLKPEVLAKLTANEYRNFGISLYKANYLINIANFWLENANDINELVIKRDFIQLGSKLSSIKGVGPWTIEMFFMFGLKAMHIFSLKDLVIVNGIKKILDIEQLNGDKYDAFMKSIKGIESLAALNIWSIMD